jgi:hypothetical protein
MTAAGALLVRAGGAYAEADCVVLLAGKVDGLDVLAHQSKVGLLLVVAVEILVLALDLLWSREVIIHLDRRASVRREASC